MWWLPEIDSSLRSDSGYYESLVSIAIRHGKVLDGRILRIKRGDLVMGLTHADQERAGSSGTK